MAYSGGAGLAAPKGGGPKPPGAGGGRPGRGAGRNGGKGPRVGHNPNPPRPHVNAGGKPRVGHNPNPPRPHVNAGGKPRGNGRNAGGGAARAAATRAANQQNALLTPMGPNAIKRMAQREINAAYKPAYGELSQQEDSAKNILAKQEADNQFYQNWLGAKTSALQSSQDAVNQSTNSLEQQLAGNQLAQYNGQANTLIGQANAREGNVSNNAQSTALGTDLANNQAQTEQSFGGNAQQALQNEQSANALGEAAQANTGATLQAGRATQQAAFQKSMQDIANLRTTTSQKQAADLEKEIARLQGVAITVAQNNRSYAASAQELGLKVATTNSEIQSRNVENAARIAGVKQAQVRLKQAQTRLAQDGRSLTDREKQNNRQYQIDKQRVNQAQQRLKIEQQRANQSGSGGGAGGKGSVPSLTPGEQNTKYDQIDTFVGEYHRLIGTGKYTPAQAYQLLKNGLTVSGGADIKPIGNTKILNAVYNIGRGYGLTAGDIAALKSLGLAHPGRRYPVHQGQPPKAPPGHPE